MRRIYLLAAGALVIAACYSDANQMGTLPAEPPNVMYGPPGGNADPYPQQAPPVTQNPYGQDPSIYQQPADGFQQPADGDLAQLPDQGDPNGQPIDPKGDVTDDEIDAALTPYGQWSDDPDYGRVWRPDPTQVGMDFTPYESGGGWVDSDDGWAFDASYGWGWLPFHYGRWGWSHGSWCWAPDHHWGAAWVDWRHGNGVIGWRPQGPLTRDHRMGRAFDSNWRFANQRDFNSHNIHGHILNSPAEGLRVTAPVASLPFRGASQVHTTAIMQNRVTARQAVGGRGSIGGGNTIYNQPHANQQRAPQPTWQNNRQQAIRQPAQSFRQPAYRQPTYQPAYRNQGQQSAHQGYRGYSPPARAVPYNSGSHSVSPSYGGGSHSGGSSASHASGGSSGSHSGGGGGHHK